jgi:UDP-glucuronate 4-epimerase
MRILITGVAGFIGMHTAIKLLNSGHKIIGIDNLNSYYDINLKIARLKKIGIDFSDFSDIKYNIEYQGINDFTFIKLGLEDLNNLKKIFEIKNFDIVLNLAAQAGVRYSISNPETYITSNIIGFYNILECCKIYPVKHLLFASSSSVYGNSKKTPFEITDKTDEPVSLYAATKKSNEIIAYSYSHLYKIPISGLRFFTVYGPWGRPDMAYFMFTQKIFNSEKIQLFNSGNLMRDFTYIDDVVISINKLINITFSSSNSEIPFAIHNVGNSKPELVSTFLKKLEKIIGKKAIIENVSKQLGDVDNTFADTTTLNKLINFVPSTDLDDGLLIFIKWFREFYKLESVK